MAAKKKSTTPSPASKPSPDQFEKLASFYLGRHYDLDAGELTDELLMYDAKDLTTHAMCVGMTGSGKTGLCLSLLEEAAIDGIPAICIDPKGDLANLMLAFPDLKPDDFEPWVDEGEAVRKGMTRNEFAADRAELWRSGLAAWGQSPDRIAKFKRSADVSIYTPGSNIGLPITVLKSFDAPPREVMDDREAMAERVTGATSGLLALMGVEADPLSSPEHILIATILDHAWRNGDDVTIGDLIAMIANPPIDRIGVLDLDTFMSSSDRSKLAMRLNNLLASPAFASWLEGEPLSIKKLMHTDDGKPRLSIISIAHLSDSERMFFVTILLGELLAWVRTQRGTSSLRALFYMDEVAGYFPPVRNPPSKPPMLTLLKQARAFGLGITLATQNPVDLDYKGLSNIGTWFLGRLQTERDKARVLEGLEGAAVQAGGAFDRGKMERTLAGLGNRVFLMNNVHDDGPSVFQTRFAMSFLSGPISRTGISRLMADKKDALAQRQPTGERVGRRSAAAASRPVTPSGIKVRYVRPDRDGIDRSGGDGKRLYRPAVYAEASLHFIRASADLDQWRDVRRFVRCERGVPDPFWDDSRPAGDWRFEDEPRDEFAFAELPTDLSSKSAFRSIEKAYKDYLYRHHTMTIYKSPLLGEYATGGLSEGEARVHFDAAVREERDRQTEKLRTKYAKKMKSLDAKIRTAEERVAREEGQYESAKMSGLISIGSSLLGAFMGRKVASRTNVSKMGTAARAGSRAVQQRDDVRRAEEALRELAMEQTELDDQLRDEINALADEYSTDTLELDPTVIAPRKSDLKVDDPILLWLPWTIDRDGIALPAFEMPAID